MNVYCLKQLLLLIPCFFYYNAVGQVNPGSDPKVTYPSPEAQAFAKFGAYPVDNCTGVPKISIPLYDIKAGKLSLPISLAYHAGGIKVNEIASSTGLGWSLQAGGMLSRTVNQREDEDGFLDGDNLTTAQISNFPEEPASNPSLYGDICQQVRSIFSGGKDGRSDDYYYSVGDKLSGQFVYDTDRNIQKLSFNNDSIIRKNLSSYEVAFEIVGDDGTRYLFDDTEKVMNAQTTNNCPGSWLVTQMISNDNADTIFFEYNHFAPFGYSIRSYSTDYRSGVPQVQTDYSNMNYNGSVLLKKIKYRGGSVDFNYEGGRLDLMDNRLSSIVINKLNENNVEESIRKYQLVHDYFRSGSGSLKYSNRLKLTEIKNYDQSNAYINSYLFSYNALNLPPISNRDDYTVTAGNAQDYWGYFNGQTGNPHLIPLPAWAVATMGPSAIRTVSETDMKACSLERIDFPTGGYTKFEFEANRLSQWTAYPTGVGGLRIKKITSTADANAIPVVKQYEYIYGDLVNDLTIGRYTYSQATDQVMAPSMPGGLLNQNLVSRAYFYSNSIMPMSEHNGSPVYYTSVNEIMDDNNGHKQKTEHSYLLETDRNYEVKNTLYGNYNYSENGRYSEGYYANRSWARGQELETRYYKFDGATYKLIKSVTNAYADKKTKTINTGLIVTEKIKAVINDPTYPCTYTHPGYTNFFYFDVLVDAGIKKIIQQKEIYYDDNGITLSTTTDYAYESVKHLYPTTTTTASSKGEVIVNRTKYTLDLTLTGNAELARQRLLATNNVSAVLDQNTLKNNVQVTDLSTTYGLFNGNKAYPALVSKQYKTGSSRVELNFIQYDKYGNILKAQRSGNIPSSYIWGYRYMYPIAEVRNAVVDDIAYTSFEGSYTALEGVQELGNWQSAQVIAVADNTAPTGKKAAVLNINATAYTVSKQNLNAAKTYLLTCWIKNGGTVTVVPAPVNTTLLRETNGWKLYQYTVSGTQSIAVSSATNQTRIDELRLYPQDAQMTTYTFNPLVGMTSQSDVNNIITYYEYDPFQRLSVVRDHNRNILRQICYKYANGASTLCAGQITYYNRARDSMFTKNNCAAGGMPASILYSVPVNKYSSVISQADADQQALNEIISSGQTNANNKGFCRYFNDTMSAIFRRNNCLEGQTGTIVTYSIYERKYESLISKLDANNKARNDIDTEGQNYANGVGACTVPNETFARIFTENVNPTTHTANIVVRFYSDYAGTILKSVSNLQVSYQKTVSSEDQSATITNHTATATGNSITLLTGTTIQYYDSQIAADWYVGYTLNSSGAYTIIF